MTDKELLQHAKEAIADLYRCVDRFELCVERGCMDGDKNGKEIRSL